MMTLLRLAACSGLGMVLALLLLVTLMFSGQPELLRGLVGSGAPLASLTLMLLPEVWWSGLTGIPDAATHPGLRSVLTLCAALGQVAMLAGLVFYRLWYVR